MKTTLLITSMTFVILLWTHHQVTIQNASGRSLSAFSFEVDDYYLHGSHAYFVAEPGSKSIMPITVKNKGQSTDYLFYVTFGDQKTPPPQPNGVYIRFEPNHISLKPNEEQIINLVIELEQNVVPTVYNVGIVGSWEEPNGFMGSSVRLHIGDYFGPKAIPSNFDFPSPLELYKSGVEIENIECHGSKRVVIKESNDYPACVNFGSISKLIDRGWAKPNIFLQVSDLIPVYQTGEKISFLVYKLALMNCDWITIEIFDLDHTDGEPLLTDTAEEICLKEVRDSNSTEKTWRLYAEFPQNSMEPITLGPGNYILQVSSEGAFTDREFRVIEMMRK